MTLPECFDAMIRLARENGYAVLHLKLELQTGRGGRVVMENRPVHFIDAGAALTLCGRRRAQVYPALVEGGAPIPERAIPCRLCARKQLARSKAAA